MSENAKLVHRWFEEVWCQRNDDGVVDEMMAQEARFYGATPEPFDRARFKAVRAHMMERIPDIRIDVLDTLEMGDHVAWSTRVSGTHGETGKPISFEGTLMARIENGKFVEAHESWDFLSMFVQIGALSPEVVAKELGG